MSFETKVKRRKWTEEEKHNTLKACGSKCACCGIKLNMKTLTMEHVVPISKGGENELENLVVLCKSCNSSKADKFCWPGGYYMALENSNKLRVVENYTRKWVKENVTLETVKEYPMVTEVMGSILRVNEKTPLNKFIPQLIFDIFEITEDTVFSIIKDIGLKKTDVFDTLMCGENSFSLLGIRNRMSDKVVALFTAQVVETVEGLGRTVVLSEVYSSSYKAGMIIPSTLLNYLCDIWRSVNIEMVLVRTKDTKVFNFVKEAYLCGNIKLPFKAPYAYGDNLKFSSRGSWENGENQFCILLDTRVEDAMESVREALRVR